MCIKKSHIRVCVAVMRRYDWTDKEQLDCRTTDFFTLWETHLNLLGNLRILYAMFYNVQL